jgi:DNA-binding MarR family transcriptional regulator
MDIMLAMESDQTTQAWRAICMTHATVNKRVQDAFVAADLPPLSWFGVLAAIKGSPSGTPRMSDIADWLTLSRGGITKIVDRLEQAGLLERIACSYDRRILQARLTPAGERMYSEMEAIHVAELERDLGRLTPEEIGIVASALGKVGAAACPATEGHVGAAGRPAAVSSAP